MIRHAFHRRAFSSGAIDYSRFLTPVARARQPSPIRALLPLLQIPGMISLGGGNPNPETFPLASATVKLKDGSEFEIDGDAMATCLQYSATKGLPTLTTWLQQHNDRFHQPFDASKPIAERDTCVTTGSQQGLSAVMEMLVAPGDSILVEDPCYSGALAALKPMDCSLVPVGTDGEGLIPGALATLLDNWPAGSRRPKVLYTIPNGQNPSGASMSLNRRVELYALACKHDLIILEDDPYFHLQLDGQHGNADAPFCTAPPSLHSMDTEGRVMRFDSLSKLMSAGLRLGWVTGPKPLINQLELQFQATMLHASGLSQMIAASLLHKWGPTGFDDHVTTTQGLYRARRDAFLTSADRHLTGLAEWTSPSSGMFVWFKVPSITDTQELMEKCRDAKVVFVPGAAFSPTEQPSQYVRACFSLASVDDMDTALERFASLIKAL